MAATQVKPPFFDAGCLPATTNAYVLWLDVMGTRAIMARSLAATANFVFKLHVAALEAAAQSLRLYPVMDGLYVVSDLQAPIRTFATEVFSRLAQTFIAEKQLKHRFVIKGAIAYGPIVHGATVPSNCSPTIAKHQPYRDSILLGMPMVQAFQSEHLAPPFGIYVHESARAFCAAGEKPFTDLWWHWFYGQHSQLAKDLAKAYLQYTKWCRERAGAIDYSEDRITRHDELLRQYLADA